MKYVIYKIKIVNSEIYRYKLAVFHNLYAANFFKNAYAKSLSSNESIEIIDESTSKKNKFLYRELDDDI
jgi:hypothetical protein